MYEPPVCIPLQDALDGCEGYCICITGCIVGVGCYDCDSCDCHCYCDCYCNPRDNAIAPK